MVVGVQAGNGAEVDHAVTIGPGQDHRVSRDGINN